MAIIPPSTFRTLLAQYASAHHHRHAAKPAPHNTCDCAFRFTTAPALVASRRRQQQNDSSSTKADGKVDADAKDDVDSPAGYLTVDELARLVEWKIAHGSFFPALPKLARGNGDEVVRRVTGEAFALLLLGTSPSSSSPPPSPSADTKGEREPSAQTVMAALTTLTRLKGVGPATASLLLSVAEGGATVPFFADELFLWARAGFEECGELPSKKSVKIRYDSKEYEELLGATRGFLGRLRGEGGEEVTAREVEMVARVLGAAGRGKEKGADKGKGKEKRGKGGVDTVAAEQKEDDNTATKKANNAEQPQKRRKRGAAEAKRSAPAAVDTKASATGRRVMPRRAAARKSRAVGI